MQRRRTQREGGHAEEKEGRLGHAEEKEGMQRRRRARR
jgi:hypothetical protein